MPIFYTLNQDNKLSWCGSSRLDYSTKNAVASAVAQNGRPIHCIIKSSPQNAAIGKFYRSMTIYNLLLGLT